MDFFLQLLINGVSIGFLYGLSAMGFVMIFKSSSVLNFDLILACTGRCSCVLGTSGKAAELTGDVLHLCGYCSRVR